MSKFTFFHLFQKENPLSKVHEKAEVDFLIKVAVIYQSLAWWDFSFVSQCLAYIIHESEITCLRSQGCCAGATAITDQTNRPNIWSKVKLSCAMFSGHFWHIFFNDSEFFNFSWNFWNSFWTFLVTIQTHFAPIRPRWYTFLLLLIHFYAFKNPFRSYQIISSLFFEPFPAYFSMFLGHIGFHVFASFESYLRICNASFLLVLARSFPPL